MKPLIAWILILGIFSLVPAQAEPAPWRVVKEIPLGGDGGWDYLAIDGRDHRLFVTHDNHVLVLDLHTGVIVGSLDAQGAHGVAFAPGLNRGFISNGASGTVTIFDLKTLLPLQSVAVGQDPDAICYEPVTRQVFAFNGRSHNASVIDAAGGNVTGQIPLPGKPEFAEPDGHGSVFDNIEDQSLVLEIDAATRTVIHQWSLPTGSGPSALAIDPARHRLFTGCHNRLLYVLDSQSGRIVAVLPIGDGVDAAVYDPASRRVLVSCADGTLTVIDQQSPDDYSVEAVVKTERGARTLAYDPSTQTAYLPTAKFGPTPAATPEQPHPRPPIVPGSLKLLVVKY